MLLLLGLRLWVNLFRNLHHFLVLFILFLLYPPVIPCLIQIAFLDSSFRLVDLSFSPCHLTGEKSINKFNKKLFKNLAKKLSQKAHPSKT